MNSCLSPRAIDVKPARKICFQKKHMYCVLVIFSEISFPNTLSLSLEQKLLKEEMAQTKKNHIKPKNYTTPHIMLHTNILTGYVTKSGIHSRCLYSIKQPKIILRMKAIFQKQYEIAKLCVAQSHAQKDVGTLTLCKVSKLLGEHFCSCFLKKRCLAFQNY